MIIPWNPWEAKPVSVERRNMWAEEIAAFTTTSIQSGDSIVWGEIDEGELELTDVLVRRTARIPIPEGYVNRERLREHAAALADALADIADDVGHPRYTAESMRDVARAALRLAGRLP